MKCSAVRRVEHGALGLALAIPFEAVPSPLQVHLLRLLTAASACLLVAIENATNMVTMHVQMQRNVFDVYNNTTKTFRCIIATTKGVCDARNQGS